MTEETHFNTRKRIAVQTMKILTCNVRCFGAEDGQDGWVHRKDLCADVIRSQSADVLCFQEMWGEQYADLLAAFPGWRTRAMVDLPGGRRPMNAIFYRADRFTGISAGGYWLSETPHVPGSKSWDSACERLANWICLKDRETGVEFRVVNTHLDHIGQTARENQARLLVEDAAAYPAGYPQILTGDMNCDYRNPAIAILKAGRWQDTYALTHGTENPGHTYHAFKGSAFRSDCGKMDWVFVRGAVKTLGAGIVMDSKNGRFPSDHYFVSADLQFEAGAAKK